MRIRIITTTIAALAASDVLRFKNFASLAYIFDSTANVLVLSAKSTEKTASFLNRSFYKDGTPRLISQNFMTIVTH